MPDALPSAPDISTGAAAGGLLDLSFLRRRCKKASRISAPIPSTPSDTPSPIPALAPVDKPLSWGDKSDESEVARATLYPTIAIAPTLDDSDNVVVTFDGNSPEAYVKTMPLDTLEVQVRYSRLSLRGVFE